MKNEAENSYCCSLAVHSAFLFDKLLCSRQKNVVSWKRSQDVWSIGMVFITCLRTTQQKSEKRAKTIKYFQNEPKNTADEWSIFDFSRCHSDFFRSETHLLRKKYIKYQ